MSKNYVIEGVLKAKSQLQCWQFAQKGQVVGGPQWDLTPKLIIGMPHHLKFNIQSVMHAEGAVFVFTLTI
jgi:hypothetical protein